MSRTHVITRMRSASRGKLKALARSTVSLLDVPERIPPWQWMEQHRVLPSGSDEPGLIRTIRTPWIRWIMDRCVSRRHNKVVVCCGSQLAKTEMLISLLGWRLAIDPAPAIYYAPTMHMARIISLNRITPMILSTPALRDRWTRSRDSTFDKTVCGQRLIIGWAGSRTQTRSYSAPLVLIDERDAMRQIGAEGDVVDVASARTSGYSDPMVVVASSPLKGNVRSEVLDETGMEHWVVDRDNEIDSPTWLLWQQGTRHEWAWPCPECDEYFVPRQHLLHWEGKDDPNLAHATARLVCPACGGALDHSQVSGMNARGAPIAPGQRFENGEVVGEEKASRIYSIWISGLCSPWVSWGDRAHDLVRGMITERMHIGAMQAVVNTGFGQLYSADRQDLREEEARKYVADYKMGEVNERITLVTMGVDVSADRFIVIVRGWAPDHTSWMLDRAYIYGDTSHPQAWRDLWEYIDGTEFGDLTIDRVGIDAGYRPNNTYEFVREHRGKVHAVMGTHNQKKLYQTQPVDVDIRGRIVKHGCKLGTYNSNMAKEYVHAHMMYDHDEPGAYLVPKDVPAQYFREITAEYKTVSREGVVRFKQIRRDNHDLDAEAIAYIMAYSTVVRKRRPNVARKDERVHTSKTEKTPPQQPGAEWGYGIGASW